MGIYNIEYKDACELERLIKISIKIEKLYQKLYTLEIENKNDDPEYKKHLNYLSILIQGEKDFYKEVNLTPAKAFSWAKFLSQTKKNASYSKKENTTFNHQITLRIINTLFNICSNDYNFLLNLSNEELKKFATMLGMKFNDSNFDKLNVINCIILKDNIEKDINYTFLSLFEEQIKGQKLPSIKEKLITSKYYMIYTHKDLEALVLTNNFHIQSVIYVASKIKKDILNIEDELYYNSNNLIGSTIAKAQIYELIEINDLDYNNIQKVTVSMLCQSMLNSALLFIDEKTLSYVKNDLQEFINQSEYLSIHENSNISKSIINCCLNNTDKIKSKIKMLSLK